MDLTEEKAGDVPIDRRAPFQSLTTTQLDYVAREYWGSERFAGDSSPKVGWEKLTDKERLTLKVRWEREQAEAVKDNAKSKARSKYGLSDAEANTPMTRLMGMRLIEHISTEVGKRLAGANAEVGALRVRVRELETRLQEVNTSCTYGMDGHDMRLIALEQKEDAPAANNAADAPKLDSFERRISRHADHLSAIESRLKKIERDR